MKFLFFGIVQGLTEFLPISSSGHLYILKRLFGLNENLLSFFVILHLATLLAIIIFFYKQIKQTLTKKELLFHILIITCVSGILGLLGKIFLTRFFDSKYLISFALLINGIILLSIRNTTGKKTHQDIKLKDSFILGLLQGIAIIPGISRSGITITGLLKRGFQPKEAFSLSFLMAIPIITAAFLVEIKEILSINVNISSLILSFIAAFLSGILALHIIKKALIKVKFKNFGYYCLLIFLLTLFI
jgi:undecaprenyl-diphosphatase